MIRRFFISLFKSAMIILILIAIMLSVDLFFYYENSNNLKFKFVEYSTKFSVYSLCIIFIFYHLVSKIFRIRRISFAAVILLLFLVSTFYFLLLFFGNLLTKPLSFESFGKNIDLEKWSQRFQIEPAQKGNGILKTESEIKDGENCELILIVDGKEVSEVNDSDEVQHYYRCYSNK